MSAFIFYILLAALAQASTLQGKNVVSGTDFVMDPAKAKKGSVVVFLSARCPCSASHEEVLKKLSRKFKDFEFVGVHSNADETDLETRQHFEKASLPFPVIQDKNAQLADRFKALKTPHVFLLSPGSEILYSGGVTNSHVGPTAEKHFLEDALMAVNEGSKPKVKEQRSLGCRISRSE